MRLLILQKDTVVKDGERKKDIFQHSSSETKRIASMRFQERDVQILQATSWHQAIPIQGKEHWELSEESISRSDTALETTRSTPPTAEFLWWGDVIFRSMCP